MLLLLLAFLLSGGLLLRDLVRSGQERAANEALVRFLIISSISGEQPARSEIRRIFSLSFATCLEDFLLKRLRILIRSVPPDFYEKYR